MIHLELPWFASIPQVYQLIPRIKDALSDIEESLDMGIPSKSSRTNNCPDLCHYLFSEKKLVTQTRDLSNRGRLCCFWPGINVKCTVHMPKRVVTFIPRHEVIL